MNREELIEKYTRLHEAEQSIEAWEVLEDLKSILDDNNNQGNI